MDRVTSSPEPGERNRRRASAPPGTWHPYVLAMTWRYGLFAHWPVEPETLATHVPEPLDLETWNGRAWVGVLPFVLADAGIRGSPRFARLSAPGLAVRTPVTYRGEPAVFFFGIDLGASLLSALVGRATGLPVSSARIRAQTDGGSVTFWSRGPDGEVRFDATYRPTGEGFTAEPGSFPYWAMERRRLYAPENGGVLGAEVAHEPWPLRPATVDVHENAVFEANGLPEPTGEPVVHYCEEVPMTGSIARRLSTDASSSPRDYITHLW